MPVEAGSPGSADVIARECADDRDGGRSITMVEFQRDRGGIMPKIFGVNHHPEVIDRKNALTVLREKFDQGHVTDEWYQERVQSLTQDLPGEDLGQLLRLTSLYTLIKPLRFYLENAIRDRSALLATAGADDGVPAARL